MKKMKKALALLLAVMTVLSLAACGAKKDDAAADTTSDPTGDTAQEETSSTPNVDAIKKAGVLVVGTSADYPPYEFHTEIDGKDTIVGFDIAIAQYFADQMGVELKVVDMSFNSLLISLAKGDFDLVMAGMTPNEERKKAVDFTDVFYRNKQIVLIRAEDADKFQTMEDLVGHKGAVQTGTVQEQIAHDAIGEENTVGLVKFQDEIMELKSGKVDMVFTNSLVAAGYVAQNPDLMIQDVGIPYEDDGFAGAVQKGKEDLVEYFNGIIAEMAEQNLVEQYIAEAQELAGGAE